MTASDLAAMWKAGLESLDPRSGLLTPVLGLARGPWMACLGCELGQEKNYIVIVTKL